MARIEWETPNPTPIRHWLLTCDIGGRCASDVPAADIISWLRAAPEAVRGEVLGAFVAHEHTYAELVARAEKAEAELIVSGDAMGKWRARAEKAEAEARVARDEVQTARKVVTAVHALLDGLVPRDELRGAMLETFGLETRVGRLRDRAEKAEAEVERLRAKVRSLSDDLDLARAAESELKVSNNNLHNARAELCSARFRAEKAEAEVERLRERNAAYSRLADDALDDRDAATRERDAELRLLRKALGDAHQVLDAHGVPSGHCGKSADVATRIGWLANQANQANQARGPTPERRDAIREALHKAWCMGVSDAVKSLHGRLEWTAKWAIEFVPQRSYCTDDLLPPEFR